MSDIKIVRIDFAEWQEKDGEQIIHIILWNYKEKKTFSIDMPRSDQLIPHQMTPKSLRYLIRDYLKDRGYYLRS